MSFLFGGRPQLSSEQKIAAAETEVEMVSDLFNRYVIKMPKRDGEMMLRGNSWTVTTFPQHEHFTLLLLASIIAMKIH
jgi:hypothetical protein